MTFPMSQLPAATLPLTGNETIATLQGGGNSNSATNQTQVLASVGETTTATPAGTMAYSANAVGGSRPVWSGGGGSWQGGDGNLKAMGLGHWIVGAGQPVTASPAYADDWGFGVYWVSPDGFTWYLRQIGGNTASTAFVRRGIEFISYANGCWLASGQIDIGESSFIVTSPTPYNNNSWDTTLPFGNLNIGVGTSPLAPTSYNNDTGVFTVPVASATTQNIFNRLPSAVIPDDSWPHVGKNGSAVPLAPVIGNGTKGIVEVAIGSKQIRITQQTIDTVKLLTARPGIYTSNYITARKLGGDFSSVGVVAVKYTESTGVASALDEDRAFQLAGASVLSAGLVLNGLVWGPIKATAVQFQSGSN